MKRRAVAATRVHRHVDGHRRRVALGLPAHNSERFLAQALDSLLVQSYADFRVVAFDDGSQDRTWEILQRYASQDTRLTVVRSPEVVGLAGAWREVARLAVTETEADYFAWFSDHDWVHPDWLGRLVDCLDREPDTVLAHPGVMQVDLDGADVGPVTVALDTGEMPTPDRLGRVLFSTMGAGDAVYGLFRASALEPWGWFPLEILPDRLAIAGAALFGQVRHLPEVMRWRRLTRQAVDHEELLSRQVHTLFRGDGGPAHPVLSHATYFLRTIGSGCIPAAATEHAGLLAALHYERSLLKYSKLLRAELDDVTDLVAEPYAALAKQALEQMELTDQHRQVRTALAEEKSRADTFKQKLLAIQQVAHDDHVKRMSLERDLAESMRLGERLSERVTALEDEILNRAGRAEEDLERIGALKRRLHDVQAKSDERLTRLIALKSSLQQHAARIAVLDTTVSARADEARAARDRADSLTRQLQAVTSQLETQVAIGSAERERAEALQGQLREQQAHQQQLLADLQQRDQQLEEAGRALITARAEGESSEQQRQALDLRLRHVLKDLAAVQRQLAELAERYRWARLGGPIGILLRHLLRGRGRGQAS